MHMIDGEPGHSHGASMEHTHEHTHTHTHSHTHDQEHTHEHEHAHQHGHEHDHGHTHGCGHSHGHEHTHDCGHSQEGQGCSGCGGGCQKPANEQEAILAYMLDHNKHHAAELLEIAKQFKAAGKDEAAVQIEKAVEEFEKGNMRLSIALSLIRSENQ
ncbi:MAG: cobalt transporter [Lachnospiraceae bacterium]|jgi:hypothetical protein|nr:cobalt transporter [Lachnospiraceae bacterium]MCI8994871.1 cobalt transporter [Lachnospiraceae bacterium]MCI9135620.1 cobalt transporter [Lachnospiraceae bacterium]